MLAFFIIGLQTLFLRKKMDSQLTNAKFYDQVFVSSPDSKKEAFLRQLFARDELFCSAYANFLNPALINYDLSTLVEKLDEIALKIKNQIAAFEWIIIDDDPEVDYQEEMTEILSEHFFVNITPMIEHLFQSGNILLALRNLRVLELSFDFDWETSAPKKLQNYGQEINDELVLHEFNYLLVYFHTGIFSDVLLQSAKELVGKFIENPAEQNAHTESWKEIEKMIGERLMK